MRADLPAPHGGKLVDLLADSHSAAALSSESRQWLSWDLTPRQLCDLDLLMNGGFSPLLGFMTRADYENVCRGLRLVNGTLWPIPITLDITEELRRQLEPGSRLALRDPEGVLLAVLDVEDLWQPDRLAEAEAVYGTADRSHPGVAYLLQQSNPWYIGGRVTGIQSPSYYDFPHLRHTPAQLRQDFEKSGWTKIVAFQTCNPIHRADHELTLRAMQEIGADLLIHPSIGATGPGESEYFVRVRCYEAILKRYPPASAKLSLLPLALRMAGPREVLWHAIIRQNFGCTHFIVGPDAEKLFTKYRGELEIIATAFPAFADVKEGDAYLPEVLEELRKIYPPRESQGLTIFFSGLSGAGKSTIANILRVKLLETASRRVTLLDGDLVRKHLSSELGFSREHRDINIRRIGFVAAEIAKNGGVAICAPIAPYDAVRKEVRAMVESQGGAFILVYLSTPLAACEARDRKGLYAKARAGLVPQFTGVSDPYEPPEDAEIVIDTAEMSPQQAADEILSYLRRSGYFGLRA